MIIMGNIVVDKLSIEIRQHKKWVKKLRKATWDFKTSMMWQWLKISVILTSLYNKNF